MKKYSLLFTAFCCCLAAKAATVDTITVYSIAMKKSLQAAVVLPVRYSTENDPFPLLYLLHGGQGSFRDWLTLPPDDKLLHRLADQYNIVIVTPDGGTTSYYFDSPVQADSQYETFISAEVVEKIEALYRVIKEKRGRFISGLSMGGHGAMFIAARHPERYAAAGSMSGVMNIDTKTWNVPASFAQLRRDNFVRLLGLPKDTANPYTNFSIIGLTGLLKQNNLPLIFDVGVDDFLIEPNRDVHRRQLANGTPHDYTERPGKHDWTYWQNALPYQLLFFDGVLKAAGMDLKK